MDEEFLKRHRFRRLLKDDFEAVQRGLKKSRIEKRALRKIPTSVALDPKIIQDLKLSADELGLPYQVLMRMFIIQGLIDFRTRRTSTP